MGSGGNRAVGFVMLLGVVLSTTACGGPNRAARKYCKAHQKCRLADFNEQYSSIKDCMDEHLDDYEAFRDDVGEDCAQSYLELAFCAAPAWKKDCDYSDILNECESEYEAHLDECF